MKFIIQGELPDLNTYTRANRNNRYGGGKLKKEATNKIHWQAKKLKKIKTYPFVLKVKYFCKNKRKDPDNIVFAKKFILDGLQNAEVIRNDGWKEVKGFEENWEVDKNNPRIEVELIA